MTKELLLLRHAKSSWDDPAQADIDRPLAPRGRRDAPRIGRAIRKNGWRPKMALVSPAARTRETWQLAAAEMKHAPKPTFRDALYEAAPGQLLAELHGTPESVNSLLMLGHNPGLQDFILRLAGEGSDGEALERLHNKFPTCGLARLELEGPWKKLGFGMARLTHCLRLKDFAEDH
ncbi:histidine phosphatase family protein [Mesorhizobium sp. KR1-2]|uniref:SixA phosphatase family protein n=1 Tax=Mesorhizobium sp. KR1-2 TaxID=3156609 RepID=UPI0032B4E6EA